MADTELKKLAARRALVEQNLIIVLPSNRGAYADDYTSAIVQHRAKLFDFASCLNCEVRHV